MFPSILNYSAATYEAIIAAFIVVGLLQVFALRRKWNQVKKLRAVIVKTLTTATSAVLETAIKSSAEVGAARRAQKFAEKARDEAIRITERAVAVAEARTQDAMEARADADDAEDERRAAQPPSNTNRPDRSPPPDLASLLSLIGGVRRPRGDELLDSILGPGYSRIKTRTTFPGFTADGSTFQREPGAPETPFSYEDLKKAIGGDASDLERKIGAVEGSTVLEVVGPDGQIITGAERAEVLKDFLRNGAPNPPHTSPSFGDPYAAFADEVTKAGQVKVDEASRPQPHFPEDTRDEACDTQRPSPLNGGYGSPRAG